MYLVDLYNTSTSDTQMYRKRMHPDISDTFSYSDVTQTFSLLNETHSNDEI